ncbi:MAG TPA: hypothetical protein VH637_11810 [Streptosporangiaceae bacterium]
MTRIERIILPAGLQATAYRDERDGLIIYVSQALDARRQRAAVMEAIRASRRSGRWAGLLPPAGVAALVALRIWAWRGATALRAQPAAWAAGTTAAVTALAAAGYFAAAPHHHSPLAAGPPPAPVTGQSPLQSASPEPAPGAHPGPARPVSAMQPAAPGGSASDQPYPSQPAGQGGGLGSGQGSAAPVPSGSAPAGPAPGPAPPSSAGPAPPASPSPSPSPSPTPTGKKGACVVLLGIRVCLPPVALTVG